MSEEQTPSKPENTKKRLLTSPVDHTDPKKSKPVMAEHNGDATSSTGEAVANVTLTDECVAQITDIVSGSLQKQISYMVSNIVDGVLKGLHARITSLETENSDLKTRVTTLEERLDKAEQYSRRNCIRLSGIHESEDENLDEKIMALADAIDADIKLDEVDRLHRLGNPKTGGHKPRDIIVKMTSYRARQKLMSNKKKLKNNGYNNVYLNEDLTRTRDKIYYNCRKMLKDKVISGTWVKDGTILVKDSDSKVIRIETPTQLNELQKKYNNEQSEISQ